MEDLNSSKNASETEDIDNQADAKKRISYVARDHKAMVEFIAGVYKNLGHTEHHSNKAIAAVHKLSPDSIKQHLTSCQQYGLLEIKHRVGYKITDLFKKIYLPLNDAEKKASIVTSLKCADTYQQLFKEYEYHIVPPISGIKNHFVRNFHLKEDAAEKAAQIFIQNLDDYNLLDSRGVLISALPPKPTEPSKEPPKSNGVQQQEVENPPAYVPPPPPNYDGDLFELPIPLPNRRKAYLKYPLDSLTKKDINVITKALEFIASSLEEE